MAVALALMAQNKGMQMPMQEVPVHSVTDTAVSPES
jgi:hypothetical protein